MYTDRHEAGRILAEEIRRGFAFGGALVLALPRGGVPVGFEVAQALELPLDVFVVRKLGAPGHEELAIGAIAPDGVEVLNDALVAELGITPLQIAAIADREMGELRRRETLYRCGRESLECGGRAVVLVDDGLATGATMRAAIAALRQEGVASITVAVPVGSAETCEEICREVDRLICPLQPEAFHAVGLWYDDFSPTTDEDVCDCLMAAMQREVHQGARRV